MGSESPFHLLCHEIPIIYHYCLLLNAKKLSAPGARSQSAQPSVSAHVVDDDVGDDVHPGCVAPPHHVGKLVAGSGPGLQLVGDRLVSRPPLRPLDVFAWRGNLFNMVTIYLKM